MDARAKVVVLAAALVLGAATASDSHSAPSACAGFSQTSGQIGGIHHRRSPLRHNVVFAGLTGTRLTLEGLVLSTSCGPVKGARIDFWQADTNGHYDDTGTRLRAEVHKRLVASFDFVLLIH